MEPAPCLVHPRDLADFLLAFLPGERRKLRPTGIHSFELRYWSDWLTQDLADGRGKVDVRYDERDISSIHVRDITGAWQPVFLYHPREPFSLREHQAAQRKLRIEGKNSRDEETVHATRMELRALVENAHRLTKRARRERERRARDEELSTALLHSDVPIEARRPTIAPEPRLPSQPKPTPPAPTPAPRPLPAGWAVHDGNGDVEIW